MYSKMCVLYSLVFYVEGKTWFITQSCECWVNFQCFICTENIWQFAPFPRVADYNKLYSYYENENSFQSGIQKEHLNFKFKLIDEFFENFLTIIFFTIKLEPKFTIWKKIISKFSKKTEEFLKNFPCFLTQKILEGKSLKFVISCL